jgi:hypothetical protein
LILLISVIFFCFFATLTPPLGSGPGPPAFSHGFP